MIGVVALNPAFDVTYEVSRVDWAGVNRPDAVHLKAGGKGVNVARTLLALGSEVRLLGLAEPGFSERLAGLGMEVALTAISGETRRTVTVVDGEGGRGQTALFNEPGPCIGKGEYSGFFSSYEKAVADCSMIVLSGSLPGKVPAGAYADLIKAAGPVPVILDTSGEALALGAAAGPWLVKPNLAELAAVTGGGLPGDVAEIEAAARRLTAAQRGAVVVSLGPQGLLAVEGARSWLAAPGSAVAGNPTGAGDAVVAGLAHFAGLDWPQRLRHAVALGTATVAGRTAGEFSLEEYRRQLELVQVRA